MTEKATILCIEDEPMLLEDLQEELEDEGYRVLTAENGLRAVALLKTEVPDLILCDMMMPRMDGPATLEHVRTEHPEFVNVPFLFLTAKATRDDIIAGKRMGVDDYLTKPVDYDLLLATIETRLAQVRRIDDNNNQKLKQLYLAFKRQKAADRAVRVTFVTGSPKQIAPIKTALTELGCQVSTIPEEQLAQKNFTLAETDITFLVYSKIVHYYLKYVSEDAHAHNTADVILLTPPNLSHSQKAGLMQTGIDSYIEYPYPPVEVFKLIMKRMQLRAA